MPDAPTTEAPPADPQPGVIPEDELKRQVEARRAKREAKEAKSGEEASGPDLIRKAADPEAELSDGEQIDALEWLLGTDEESFTRSIELNVGGATEKWIAWEIRPVDLDTLRRIRKQSTGGGSRAAQRRAERSGEMDEVEANLAIVVEGTVAPDLTKAAHDRRLADPKDLLRQKFGHKPGLLGQISGEIMSISGYDDEDVREVEAAKNS